MSEPRCQLLGLAGFFVSAVLFLIAGIQAGDWLIILGCVAWMAACAIWVLPLVRTDRGADPHDGARGSTGVSGWLEAPTQREDAIMGGQDNVAIITEFVEAWSRLDADELAGYFTEDGTYHNMPTGPVTGRDNVRGMIAAFTADWTETQWDMLNIMGEGDVVIAERLDRTKAGDKAVDLPCTGIFEMENGKIKYWRDYFDIGTYLKAMS